MRIDALRRGALLVSAMWLGGWSGFAEAAPRTMLIHEVETGQLLGRGVMVAGPAGCVILIPNHLIEPSAGRVRPTVEWRDPSTRSVHEASPGEGPANPAYDYAILKPTEPPSQCGELPPLATIEASIRVTATADVELVQAGGQARLVTGRIVATTDSTFGVAHGGATADWVAPGMSGSLVSIGGVPAGMLLGVNPKKADQILVLRLDFLARLAQRWLAPAERARGAARAAADPSSASRAFWNGLRMLSIGREASARGELQTAVAAGSSAAGVALAQMLLEGQGGPADRDGGSALFDRYLPDAINQARDGDAAAAFMLTSIHADGLLTSEQEALARPAVRSVADRLRARSGADAFASSLLALIVFVDTSHASSISSDRLGKVLGLTEPYSVSKPLLDIRCQKLGCLDVQASALRSMFRAMQGGSDLAAAFLADAEPETLGLVAEAEELPIPDCSRLTAASTSPIQAAALAACTRLRRMTALQHFDPIAFDGAGDRQIWEQAVESGMYYYPLNLRDMVVGPDLGGHEKALAFARIAAEKEKNRRAALQLAHVDLFGGRVAAGLEGLRAYVAAVSGGEEAARALGELAATELLGAPGVAADPARARATIGRIRNLSAENIVYAIAGLEIGASSWSRSQSGRGTATSGAAPFGAKIWHAASSAFAFDTITAARFPAAIAAVRSELLRLAADKGSYDAVLTLIEEGMDPAPLAVTDPRRQHAYVKALLKTNAVTGAKLLCYAAQLHAEKSNSRRDAIRLCRSIFDAGLTAAAVPLARLYKDDAAARRSVLESASSTEATLLLASDLLREPRPDYPRIHKLYRRLAAGGDAQAAAVIMRLLAAGKLTWDKPYFQYLARMINRLGKGFDCWPGSPYGSGGGGFGGGGIAGSPEGCLLAVEDADIGWYGNGPPGGSTLPQISAAQIETIEEALRLTGDSVWFRKAEP